MSSLERAALSRKAGWLAMANAVERTPPERRTQRELGAMSEAQRESYNETRSIWHANLGPIRTPQLTAVHERLTDLVESNRQDGGQARGCAAISGHGGIGKTTALVTFGLAYHRKQVQRFGAMTSDGDEFLPVMRIGLMSNTTLRGFNEAMLAFYGHPGTSGSAAQLAQRCLDCVLSCGTTLALIDDVHFLNMNRRDGVELSNHLKWFSAEFPVTFAYAGIALEQRGFFGEGLAYGDDGSLPYLSQMGRRCTALTMDGFTIRNASGRQDWRRMLLSLERLVVLNESHPGDLADALGDYLFERSSGHIGSLMSLITRGSFKAVRTGDERLTRDLLDTIRIDEAAERSRLVLSAELERRRVADERRRTRKRSASHA